MLVQSERSQVESEGATLLRGNEARPPLPAALAFGLVKTATDCLALSQIFDAGQSHKSLTTAKSILSVQKPRGSATNALIIVFVILSPAGGAVTPVGVTSQLTGKFKSLDQCKAAASKESADGHIADLSLTRGAYWHCVYAGS